MKIGIELVGLNMNFFTKEKTINSGNKSDFHITKSGIGSKNLIRLGFIFSIILFVLLPCVCLGVETNESAAAGKVTVTDVVIDPSVLMTGDVGIVTFTVENTGSSNVVISDAHLISKDITVLNSDIYLGSRTIGAGTTMKFTFTILANQPENIYYPAFYLNYKDAGSFRYNIPVRVEEPQLAISVAGIPETYSKGVTSKINIQLGNAKSVNMTGITVIPSGEGIQCNRTSFFIGDLGPHTEKSVAVEIIPSVTSNLTFNVSYTCGMNSHQTSYSIPIVLGTDKLAAEPILNNIEVTTGPSGIVLSGDISNVGISDAYGVVVLLESAAGVDGNPNQKYAIGTITSGDFSSFELTLPQGSKKVPLLIQFKDSSGNQFSKTFTVDLDQISGGSSLGSNGSGPSAGGNPSGGPPGTSAAATGSSAGSGTTSRSGGGGPMNPLSSLGSGLNGIPVTEILYGAGILIILIIIWLIWRRKMKGRKLSFSIK